MKKMKFLSFAVLALVFGLFGCSTQADDEPDPTARTYPQAYNFEVVTIEHLKTQVSGPDSLNVEAYVVERFYCPPDHYCFVGDNIVISEKLNPDSDSFEQKLFLTVTNPLQFEVEHLYVLSIEVRKGNDEGEKYLRLLGYSE